MRKTITVFYGNSDTVYKKIKNVIDVTENDNSFIVRTSNHNKLIFSKPEFFIDNRHKLTHEEKRYITNDTLVVSELMMHTFPELMMHTFIVDSYN